MTKSFSRVADTYDATRGGIERGQRFAPTLARILPPGPVLEIGVGTGAVARPLADTGREVVGIDISFEMIARARDRLGPRVAVGDATRLPVRDASFDGAYSIWVMHLLDRAATFREAARVVRPGGRYVVSGGDRRTPPVDELDTLRRSLFDQLLDDPPPDHPDELIRIGGEIGWRLVAEHRGVEGTWTITPNELIDQIEARSYSVLWDLPPQRWDAVVAPILEAVRALPDPAVPRARSVTPLFLEFARR